MVLKSAIYSVLHTNNLKYSSDIPYIYTAITTKNNNTIYYAELADILNPVPVIQENQYISLSLGCMQLNSLTFGYVSVI